MLKQSTLILKSRILDCFDFLQKSRNDGVSGIVIAICFAFCAVIARFDNVESWQSKQTLQIKYAQSANLRPLSVIARALPEAIQKIKSFCFVLLLQNEESPYPLNFNLQSKIPPIHSWVIYFSHCFKLRDLDTSLRINATLSMTKKFGLLRRFIESPRNDGVGADCHALTASSLAMTIRRRFAQFTRFATFHTTLKGIKMQI